MSTIDHPNTSVDPGTTDPASGCCVVEFRPVVCPRPILCWSSVQYLTSMWTCSSTLVLKISPHSAAAARRGYSCAASNLFPQTLQACRVSFSKWFKFLNIIVYNEVGGPDLGLIPTAFHTVFLIVLCDSGLSSVVSLFLLWPGAGFLPHSVILVSSSGSLRSCP